MIWRFNPWPLQYWDRFCLFSSTRGLIEFCSYNLSICPLDCCSFLGLSFRLNTWIIKQSTWLLEDIPWWWPFGYFQNWKEASCPRRHTCVDFSVLINASASTKKVCSASQYWAENQFHLFSSLFLFPKSHCFLSPANPQFSYPLFA